MQLLLFVADTIHIRVFGICPVDYVSKMFGEKIRRY